MERNITFECKKCGHQLIIMVPDDVTVVQLLEKFEKLSNLNCPNCGEESYRNWYFDAVKEKLPTDVRWIDEE